MPAIGLFMPSVCNASTDPGLRVTDFGTPRAVMFAATTKGNSTLKQDAECNTGSGQCSLQ